MGVLTPDKLPNVYVAALARSLTVGGSETEIYVSSIRTLDGQVVTTADISSFLGEVILSVDVQSANRIEFISATGVDPVNNSFTGAIRGLSFKDKTVIAANKKFHAVGTPVLISWGTQNIIDLETIINDNYTELYNLIQSTIIGQGVPATTTNPGLGFDGSQEEIDNGLGSKNYAPTGLDYPVFVDGATLKQFIIDNGIPTALQLVAGEDIDAGQAVFPGNISSSTIVFDNSDSQHKTVNNGTVPFTVSNPFTIGAGINGYLILAIETGAGSPSNAVPAVSVPTYGGDSMTLLQSDSTGGVNRYLYGLANPSAGINNIEFTISQSGPNPFIGNVQYEAFSYFNVGTVTSAKAASVASMTIATGSANSVVFGFAGVNGGPTPPKSWTSANLVNHFRNDVSAAFDGSTNMYTAAGNTAVVVAPTTVTVSVATGGTTPGTPDIMFAVAMAPYGSTVSGGVFLAEAVTNYAEFIGFALESVLQGEPIKVQTAVGSLVTGLTGLTPNAVYYLSDTPGAISSSPGTHTKKVGIAITATSLILLNSLS